MKLLLFTAWIVPFLSATENLRGTGPTRNLEVDCSHVVGENQIILPCKGFDILTTFDSDSRRNVIDREKQDKGRLFLGGSFYTSITALNSEDCSLGSSYEIPTQATKFTNVLTDDVIVSSTSGQIVISAFAPIVDKTGLLDLPGFYLITGKMTVTVNLTERSTTFEEINGKVEDLCDKVAP